MIVPGNMIKLSGGYYRNPKWLCGQEFYFGKVLAFLSEDLQQILVAELDQEITVGGLTGKFIVLSLRHKGDLWGTSGIAHVVLCTKRPPFENWQRSSEVKWVEAAASYEYIEEE